jgi:hypothetical protein
MSRQQGAGYRAGSVKDLLLLCPELEKKQFYIQSTRGLATNCCTGDPYILNSCRLTIYFVKDLEKFSYLLFTLGYTYVVVF